VLSIELVSHLLAEGDTRQEAATDRAEVDP
jgi:hypothetical protein